MKADDTLRQCPICHTPLVRRPDEKSSRWRDRQVCSQACGYKLSGRKRTRSVPIQQPRTCSACHALVVRRPNEQTADWNRRRTCSRACGRVSALERRRERLMVQRRAQSPHEGVVVLTDGTFAQVDPEDFERVIAYSWHPKRQPGTEICYAASAQHGRCVYLHRYVLGLGPNNPDVEHIDGDGLNNRRINLRLARSRQRKGNWRRAGSSMSGYRGVLHDPSSGKWRAMITVSGRRIHLGTHDTPEDAAYAYDAAAREHQGSIARLNFPCEDDRPDMSLKRHRREHDEEDSTQAQGR